MSFAMTSAMVGIPAGIEGGGNLFTFESLQQISLHKKIRKGKFPTLKPQAGEYAG